MAETETRLNTLITVFTLIIVGVTVAIFAVWKHGSSLRATQAAENFRRSSERFENLSKFMDLISNSQPTGIVAVDGNTAYTYANEPAANEAGIPYGAVAMSTDYDCWKEDEEPVSWEQVLEVFGQNVERVKQ